MDYTVWRPGLTDWLYEEVTPLRTRRALRILREPLADSGCRIYVPNGDAWDDRAPSWARGRRDELVARIRELFGPNTLFEDVDSIDGRICADAPPETHERGVSWWAFVPEIFIVLLAIAAVGQWAATQVLAGRWLAGGLVLPVWLGGIVALAWLAVRRRYVTPGVAAAGVLTVVGVATALVLVG
jgi:hypothetical protein